MLTKRQRQLLSALPQPIGFTRNLNYELGEMVDVTETFTGRQWYRVAQELEALGLASIDNRDRFMVMPTESAGGDDGR